MRTSINYSGYTNTTYYAVGRDMQLLEDTAFDKFIAAVGTFEGLKPFIESETEDSIMFRIPNENADNQILINKIAMIAYQGCIYRDEYQKSCKFCPYPNLCKTVNGKEMQDDN